jgi:hypothetical protein
VRYTARSSWCLTNHWLHYFCGHKILLCASGFCFLFFFQYWSLNSGPSPWATPPALFLWRVFWDRVSQTICLGWLRTMILLISASWVARIIGMSHQCPAHLVILYLHFSDYINYDTHSNSISVCVFICIHLFICDTADWTQGLQFAGQALFHGSYASSPLLTILKWKFLRKYPSLSLVT